MDGIKVSHSLEPLSRDQLKSIHSSTLEVLEKTGVRVRSQKALKLLGRAGANVDHNHEIARIPRDLIEQAMKNCPRKILLAGQDRRWDLEIGRNDQVYVATGAAGPYVLDSNTMKRRDATRKDLEDLTCLADALDNIHIVLALVTPQDVIEDPARVRCALVLKNTVKHFMHDAQGAEGARDQLRMAAAIVGGERKLRNRPIVSFIQDIVPPLTHDNVSTEAMMEFARQGIPVDIESGAISGAGAPVTLAGTLVQQNAEVLSGILMAQLVRKGTPVMYGTFATVMDMRTGYVSYGAPEHGLINAATAQLSRYYGIPCNVTAGLSDSKTLDIQAAYEKVTSTLLCFLAGANIVHMMCGQLEFMMTASYPALVIDDEITGMLRRIVEGIEVTEETMAVEVIDRVGPGGNYLGQRHTRDFLKTEQWIPKLLDRNVRETWERTGKDILRKAVDEARRILKEHKPKPLTQLAERELKRIAKL